MMRPAPGFRGNFCAHFTRFYGHPAYKEFNLRDEGLEYVFPDTNEAIIFDDETSYVSYAAFPVVNPKTGETKYSEENVKKTYDQIARFSKPDAEAYLDLTEKYREIMATGICQATGTQCRLRMGCRMPWKN